MVWKIARAQGHPPETSQHGQRISQNPLTRTLSRRERGTDDLAGRAGGAARRGDAENRPLLGTGLRPRHRPRTANAADADPLSGPALGTAGRQRGPGRRHLLPPHELVGRAGNTVGPLRGRGTRLPECLLRGRQRGLGKALSLGASLVRLSARALEARRCDRPFADGRLPLDGPVAGQHGAVSCGDGPRGRRSTEAGIALPRPVGRARSRVATETHLGPVDHSARGLLAGRRGRTGELEQLGYCRLADGLGEAAVGQRSALGRQPPAERLAGAGLATGRPLCDGGLDAGRAGDHRRPQPLAGLGRDLLRDGRGRTPGSNGAATAAASDSPTNGSPSASARS